MRPSTSSHMLIKEINPIHSIETSSSTDTSLDNTEAAVALDILDSSDCTVYLPCYRLSMYIVISLIASMTV